MVYAKCALIMLGVAVVGCSGETGTECPPTAVKDGSASEVLAPACDCVGQAGVDQQCPPRLVDGGTYDAHSEVVGPQDQISFADGAVDVFWYSDQTYFYDVSDSFWFSDAGSNCCSAADPCNLSHNGTCNCGAEWAWDDWDCYLASQEVYLYDSYGESYEGSCCSISNPCDWANDGVCDCGGAYWWDEYDCSYAGDVYFSDGWYGDSSGDCCSSANPCDWADDGYCDCGGAFKWDHHDCQNWMGDVVTEGIVFCGEVCSYYDVSDVQENCCSEWDPCGWSNDGMCDCKGLFGWDYLDCN